MVANPDICRLNGSKSRGPTSGKGKAIAARNATKHGLLAQQPPLLVTEDLATFEGLVQGLIDYYQPENPVEHFLIQQVAMGMLKQHRLWSVQAAIANLEILKTQQKTRFPDVVIQPKTSWDSPDLFEQRIPLEQELTKEKISLEGLIHNFEHFLSNIQKLDQSATLRAFHDTCGENYYHRDRTAEVYQYQDEFDEWLSESWNEKRKKYTADFQEAIARANQLIKLGRRHLEKIDQTLRDIETTEQAIQQARTASEGIQKPELFTRYQRDINRELYEALDRLETIRQRKNEGSMGSFGQTADLSSSRGGASFPSQ